MGPVYAAADIEAGRTVYQEQCAACHASDGAGNPDMKAAMPRLDIRAAVAGNPDGLRQVIRSGKGAMPAFTTLTEDELRQVLRFLRFGAAHCGAGLFPLYLLPFIRQLRGLADAVARPAHAPFHPGHRQPAAVSCAV